MTKQTPTSADSRHGVGVSFAMAVALLAVSSAQQPQSPPCDQGVIRLPANINGTVTICSSLVAQVPALARQLQDITKVLGTQQAQIAEMNRLVRNINGVSQNIGLDRQAQLLRNLFAQLQISQRVSTEQTQRQMSALADGFERLGTQMLGALTDRATVERASAAVDGPLGDAIAQLDLTGAEQVLVDIRSELRAIGSQVAEVNRRTADIQRTLDQQRMELPRVGSALAAVDVASLESLTTGGLAPSVIEEALRQPLEGGKTTTANRFFENSIGSPDAMAWFDSVLAAGVDPNLTVPSEYYGREGLLIAAMRAGNTTAMKLLLRRGSNPHATQDLRGTRFAENRFLFPLTYIADDNRLGVQDKQDLTKAFVESGVVIPPVVAPKDPSGWPSVMYAARGLQEIVASTLAVTLPAPSPLGQIGPICRRASQQLKEDWCGIIAKLPTSFVFTQGRQSPVYNFELKYVLGIHKDRATFLALAAGNRAALDYVAVDVTKDGSSWTILTFTYARAFCKREDTYEPDYCWQAIVLQRPPGTEELRLRDLRWTIAEPGTALNR